jgi:hypothetical protein
MDSATDLEAGSRRHRLHRLVLWWVAFPFVLFWLPLVRSVVDGPTYQWGVGWWGWRLGGAGLEGDLWYLAAGTVLGGILLWSGARSGGFFRWAAPAWMLMLLARATHIAVTVPDGFVFHGDTLGIRLNLTWVAPTFHAVGLLLFAVWLLGWSRSGGSAREAAGSPARTGWVVALAALLPVQVLLLRFGEPHGTTDAVGVLITIGQWLALPWAMGAPGRSVEKGRTPGRA